MSCWFLMPHEESFTVVPIIPRLSSAVRCVLALFAGFSEVTRVIVALHRSCDPRHGAAALGI